MDHAASLKCQQTIPYHFQQQQQYIQHVPDHVMPNNAEWIEFPALPNISSNSPSTYQQSRPHVIHSPLPIYPKYTQPELFYRASSNGSFCAKQENTVSLLSTLLSHTQSPCHAHISDFSAYSHTMSDQHLYNQPLDAPVALRPVQKQLPIEPTEFSLSTLSSACVQYDGNSVNVDDCANARPPALNNKSYAGISDPQFASEGTESRQTDGVGQMAFLGVCERGNGCLSNEGIDTDAEGNRELDGYALPHLPPDLHQREKQHMCGVDLNFHVELQKLNVLYVKGEENEYFDRAYEESEGTDVSQDPDFVTRGPCHTAVDPTAYPYIGGHVLPSTRYTPSPPSPTYRFGFANVYGEYLGPRQSVLSTSSFEKEPTAPSTSHGCHIGPPPKLPVPVPITKMSRGRRVPTVGDLQGMVMQNGKKKNVPGMVLGNSARTYMCDVDGCGKLFSRGEHLRRHVRGIHTYEKRKHPP